MKSTRREMIVQTTATAAGISLLNAGALAADTTSTSVSPELRYCLNTSTIAGHRGKTPLDREIDLIAKAGYSGIEPWMREIQSYRESGGKLSDLKKRLDDHGMKVESAMVSPTGSLTTTRNGRRDSRTSNVTWTSFSKSAEPG